MIMEREFNPEEIGEELGLEGVGQVVRNVEAYCTHEVRRITLTNEAAILGLKAEGTMLLKEEASLKDRLRHAPPPRDVETRERKAAYYWAVTAILALAGFIFSLIAFDPYRLGWKSYVYCLGIAVVTPFFVEKVLERWDREYLFKVLTATGCVAALVGLILLAVIRGDLLLQQFAVMTSAVVLDDAPPQPQPQNDFYATTLILLRFVMTLLAIAMELGAGLALYEAWRMGARTGEDGESLRLRLGTVQRRLIAITCETKELQNEAGVFSARLWRTFYRSMLTHTAKKAMLKLLLFGFLALSLGARPAAAAEHVNIVLAVDLTQSVATTGPNGETEFTKNLNGVARLLAHAPANAHITVIGITDASFTQPYVLLGGNVPEDPGYFGEKLQAARTDLVKAWKHRTASLAPRYLYTDILGALLLAGQVFDEDKTPGRKMLVVFSDMRHHTRELDLESPSIVPPYATVTRQSNALPAASLRGVEVHVLGVDGAGKSVEYWQSLQRFWADCLTRSGAALRSFSVLRNLPVLE
jgi:hypothetical protein